VIVGTSSSAGISSETFSASQANFFTASVAVGVDNFIAPNFSLGIDLEGVYRDNKGYGATSLVETTSTELAAGLRFGLNLPLGRSWSWYPRLTLGVSSNHSDSQTSSVFAPGATADPPSTTSQVGPWINLYAPLLVHPVPHFFVGFGPRLQRRFAELKGGAYDGSQTTLLSAEFTVGGCWGGARSGEPGPENEPRGPAFGDRGQVVLTTATSASVAYNSYTNSTASNVSVALSPGVDYFVTDHVSLGVAASVSSSSGHSFDTIGVETDVSSTSFGFAPRVGFDIPLKRGLVSLWPLAGLGFGVATSNQTSAAGSNDHTRSLSWVTVSAPLLVHPTTHMFLGAGPYVMHELSDTDQNHFENDATTVGASFLLGGWL
jgi:hypothetical protein